MCGPSHTLASGAGCGATILPAYVPTKITAAASPWQLFHASETRNFPISARNKTRASDIRFYLGVFIIIVKIINNAMEPSTIEQRFGDAEVADGSFLFQGTVTGNVHINREY